MMLRLVVWIGFVCFAFTHGFPHGGRVVPVNKRSDYSMYDNQFFTVGDTPLDNEVTDCMLVRHQYARGYIRLREFLERMQGCGRKGKMSNIAGIAASVNDVVDVASPGTPVASNPVVKAAPFKPRPIGEIIENAIHQKPQISAYHNQGLKTQLPIPQQVQRSKTGFGFFAQGSGPLSYSLNPATSSLQSPVARKLITRKDMDIPQAQALENLNSAKDRKQGFPDPQRYYSDQASAMARPYSPSVTVGQPLVRPNPLPLAFHQQTPVTSVTPPSQPQAYQPSNPDLDVASHQQTPITSITPPSQPQAYQPSNPDLDVAFHQQTPVTSITPPSQPQTYQPSNPDLYVDKVVHQTSTVKQPLKTVVSPNVVKPVKQVSNIKSGKIRDDILGDQVMDEGMHDEADEAEIDNQESDPLPPETSFTYNPRLEEEDTSRVADAKADAENSQANNLPNTKPSTLPLNNIPNTFTGNNQEHGNNDDISNGPLHNKELQQTLNVKTPLRKEPSVQATPQKAQQVPDDLTTPQKAQQVPDDLTTPQKSQQVPDDLTTPQKSQQVPDDLTTPQKSQQVPDDLTTPQKEQQTPNVQTTPLNVPPVSNAQTPQKSQSPIFPQHPVAIKGDDLEGLSQKSNKLEEFLKPASSNNVAPDQPGNVAQSDLNDQGPAAEHQSVATPDTPRKKHGHGLSINLDVLRNRISSSKNVGFLKRMLSLIKKITHHKDFEKLGGVQKNAIMQAGEAVHNAVFKPADVQRSFIQPRPPTVKQGEYSTQGYVAPGYGASSGAQRNAVQYAVQGDAQRSVIQTHPPKWKPGDYTTQQYVSPAYTGSQVNYAYPTYQASLQYHPPHWKPGDYTTGTGSTNAQLYKPRQTQITKKFQIERNPYYQRPVAYTPPYFSLQRLNYGLYNGNVP
ncbi:hypothetical protein QZH41_010876 [Actinostola sp. cb2023]|nr:hypothetical protein QZH41_010876 [Actinostola sp. cb2023]